MTLTEMVRTNDVLVIWYCRGCKNSVERAVTTAALTVECPKCGTEHKRFADPETKR